MTLASGRENVSAGQIAGKSYFCDQLGSITTWAMGYLLSSSKPNPEWGLEMPPSIKQS
jgi:hypothetical protein